MSKTVHVDLGDRSYDIVIGSTIRGELGPQCKELGLGSSCLVITDDNVARCELEACRGSLEGAGFSVADAAIPHGEPSKSEQQLFEMYDRCLDAGLDRKGFIVALGGGVVGDLAGYAAGSYLRGIDYIQVPTSVVAMVDSAVGGKTGINLPSGKNLIGVFHQPKLVWVDLDSLGSLPPREFNSGLAEVVKYGVIYDGEFFQWLEKKAQGILDRDPDLLAALVARSCEIKAEVVSQDEREGGLRAILNFGHTLGHAIEKVAEYGTFLHGEAISVGMVFAALVSSEQTGLSGADAERITRLLAAFNLPVTAPELNWDALKQAMSVDKKVQGGIPRFVLANDIGTVAFGCEVDEALLVSAWKRIIG